ncbi:MAG TPA: SRPBCC family protein [Bacteroidota bacterium]|nr:SRPBCC family protein [Bacteroidota bacterium]
MISIQISVDVACPVDFAFNYLIDPDNYLSWQSGLTHVSADPPGPIRVGSLVETKGKLLGRAITTVAKTAELEHNKRQVYESVGGPFYYRGELRLEPLEIGTRITHQIHADLDAFFILTKTVLYLAAKTKLSGDLDVLKEILESLYSASAQP